MLRGYHYTMLALTPLYHSSSAKAKNIAMHPMRPKTKLPVIKAYTNISTPASCTTLDADVPSTCTPCQLSKASWSPCHSACIRLCRRPYAPDRQCLEAQCRECRCALASSFVRCWLQPSIIVGVCQASLPGTDPEPIG